MTEPKPNAEWCPICYGWQEIEPGGCATDHYLDHHREWLLKQPKKPARKLVKR